MVFNKKVGLYEGLGFAADEKAGLLSGHVAIKSLSIGASAGRRWSERWLGQFWSRYRVVETHYLFCVSTTLYIEPEFALVD
jgi:hypothetical protein